ncbi:hypothetical protein KJ682_08185 [bacterium]|nr:hypothetical protein [bacterium]
MRGLTIGILAGAALLAAAAGATPAPAEGRPQVVATYFHRTLRCQTCLQIEALARYDVTGVMASDVESGRLVWRSVDFEVEDDASNRERFGLDGPSLVITLEDGGKVLRWVRLDRVWEFSTDVAAFDEYVLGALEEYLTAASEIVPSRNSSQ